MQSAKHKSQISSVRGKKTPKHPETLFKTLFFIANIIHEVSVLFYQRSIRPY